MRRRAAGGGSGGGGGGGGSSIIDKVLFPKIEALFPSRDDHSSNTNANDGDDHHPRNAVDSRDPPPRSSSSLPPVATLDALVTLLRGETPSFGRLPKIQFQKAVKKALVRLHSQNRISLPDRFLDLLGLNPNPTTSLARMRIGSKSSDDGDRQRRQGGKEGEDGDDEDNEGEQEAERDAEEDVEEDGKRGNRNKADSDGPAERSQLNAELYRPVSALPTTTTAAAQKGNENEDDSNTNAAVKQPGQKRPREPKLTHKTKLSRKAGPLGAIGGVSSRDESDVTPVEPKRVAFCDVGGAEEAIATAREVVLWPMAHPEVYRWLGVQPPRGILLHGPPGTGKTMLANAIAYEAKRTVGAVFFSVSAPQIVSGMSGESEGRLRAIFKAAKSAAPAIIFLDEIDAICPRRDTAQREMERRIVAQLLTCMDDLGTQIEDEKIEGSAKESPSAATTAAAEVMEVDGSGPEPGPEAASGHPPTVDIVRQADQCIRNSIPHVIVLGATNRADAIDPALRRAGRFDREVLMGIPDEKARLAILTQVSTRLRLESGLDMKAIAKATAGFVGADLSAVAQEAAASALSKLFRTRSGDDGAQEPAQAPLPWSTGSLGTLTPQELSQVSISTADFEAAVGRVQPSAKREGFATVPDISWANVGALDDVRDELYFAITQPIRQPEKFEAMGLGLSQGVLLYGPPGCGKTLVAKATANEANASFLSVKGPELLSKYVGDSERAVRTLFMRARASAPAILFFDELDAFAPKRGSDSGNAAAERVVNQLLTELDGLESRKAVFVIAATNRPDMVDPAMMRPGRLDRLVFVPLPEAKARGRILHTLARHTPIEPSLDVHQIAESEACENFSGADLAALLREACVSALRGEGSISNSTSTSSTDPVPPPPLDAPPPLVTASHFKAALTRVGPSVSAEEACKYLALRLEHERRGRRGK